MRTVVSPDEIAQYRADGFLVIEEFLASHELMAWRSAIEAAVSERTGVKIPGRDGRTGESDGINRVDASYFGNVFDQLINLWQTNEAVRTLICDPRIGKLASDLSGSEGIRVWHDQALYKRPWANPTTLHLDLPYWSFDHRNALSIWIALDDVTMQNGCLYFLPGSHRHTNIDESPISTNMNAIFVHYPALASVSPVAVPMRAGSASFHNGLTIHGAGPNMTTGQRRAMTCAFMPDGSTFNGKANVLPQSYLETLLVGDALISDAQNPLIYSPRDSVRK